MVGSRHRVAKMEEESLGIDTWKEIPSAQEFTSQIEPRNVPAVFNGCTNNWKAFSKWNPSNEGLDYLQGRVGSSIVEAMLSKSAPVFYGDIRSHERVPLPFSTFIACCKELFYNRNDGHGDACFKPEKYGPAGSETEEGHLLLGDASQHIYLAQVPIMNFENKERVQLEGLREDIQTPSFLEKKALASVNLWMNGAETRSSTHYDPHHNLLCIVTGCKRVVLWPPSASPYLYPLPLYGEASNHSGVALEKPDLSAHPRAERATEYSQKIIIHAGNALFIPEGWFHQVDSDKLTIAVNFWWRSDMVSGMSEHMDSYYLRRILKRLTDKEMNQGLYKASADVGKIVTNTFGKPNIGKGVHLPDQSDPDFNQNYLRKGSKGENLNQRITLHELEPLARQSLHELISLVHERINTVGQSEPVESNSTTKSAVGEKEEFKRIVKADFYHLKDDPVANIFWTLQPLILQGVFLAMAHNFPRSLEALILHLLSPVGAEVLTRKFDEMDQLIVEEDRNEFYRIFYGVFDDQFAAMDALLNGKESFARQAFKNVLDQYLGIKFDGQKPCVGGDIY